MNTHVKFGSPRKIKIFNKKKLLENSKNKSIKNARNLALTALEFAVNAVDPLHLLNSKLLLEHEMLKINDLSLNLKDFKDIYVVGGGKAGCLMAQATENIIGKWISSGVVNVPYNNFLKTEKVQLNQTSHPLPDQQGIKGTKEMIQFAERAGEKDLVICLLSGGGSSLMPLPPDGISLEDKQYVTNLLLKSGATIQEINIVRKHISDFKGGLLAKKVYPATLLNIILSDVVGDNLGSIASGPTVPDNSTYSDAVNILKKFYLWKKIPESIKNHLLNGLNGLIDDTPKKNNPIFKKVYNVIIGNNSTASNSAIKVLKSKNLNTLLLTSTLEGEAKHVGTVFGAIANEIISSGNPIPKPAGLIAGGETTVKVSGNGRGGRNQEIVLASAIKLLKSKAGVIASLSTDGIDGPTDAAGAIIDCCSIDRAKSLNLDPAKYLINNDSYSFFSKLNDLIITGQTNTNVNDVSVIVIL